MRVECRLLLHAGAGVDESIGQFVAALRNADVEVSPAETLDAMAAVEIVGVEDRGLLRRTLALTLAKSPVEKAAFNMCFDRFFSNRLFAMAQPSAEASGDANAADVSGDVRDTIRNDVSPRPGGTIDGELDIDANGSAGTSADADETTRVVFDGPRKRRRRPSAPHDSALGHLLMQGDYASLSVAIGRAAAVVQLSRIKALRERQLYARRILLHMGYGHLEDEIGRLSRSSDGRARDTSERLGEAAHYLSEQVREYVEDQYLLLVDASGNRFIAQAAAAAQLTSMQVHYFDHIREAVRKLAHKLAKRHARRRRIANRGHLDLRRTLRRNLAYDGTPFDLQWRTVRLQRPRVFVLCDVSGSVRNVARFLLTFLYSLHEVLPRVRAFAFSNQLGEISEYFTQHPLTDAIEMSLDDYGKGSTDYGVAFRRLVELAIADMDSRSTLIILGDARNNYFETGEKELRRLASRCRQVIWLNPESEERWGEGDSEMRKYRRHCDVADVCNSLTDLERIVSRVLRTGQ
jgi:uncharacterized protein with von Willebrand factor type A (vWA) domain